MRTAPVIHAHSQTTFPRRVFRDKQDEKISLEKFRPTQFPDLVEMYIEFEPKQVAMGLPPPTRERIESWLQSLTQHEINLLAVAKGKIVGHCVICKMDEATAELAIFLLPRFQNRGIGMNLIRLAKRLAKPNFEKIWLTVESTNLQAIRVFLKSGFVPTDRFGAETEMILKLRSDVRTD